MEYQAATTTDSMPGTRRMTRSTVDENTVLFAGLPVKTKVKGVVALSVDITVPSQSDVYTVEEKQTIINDGNGQESNGQHPVSSKQQVDKPLILSSELDDTAELDIDFNDESIIDELFSEHSLSIICENDVMLNRASYPETIEGCIQVINKLCHAVDALHLIITENEHLLECLKLNAHCAQYEADRAHKEWGHRVSEYHRSNHEIRSGRGRGGGSRTVFQNTTEVGRGERQRSKSSGPATPVVNSRLSNRRSADQRRDTSRPSYNMNQVVHGV